MKEIIPIINTQKYSNIEGRSTNNLNVQLTKYIGSGQIGDVYETEINIGNKIKKFVVKKFKNTEGVTAIEHANKAFDGYKLAKEAKLKVFPTYRLGEDKESILMTRPNLDECFVFSPGRDIQTEIKEAEIKLSKEDISKIAHEVFQEAIKASQSGIELYFDSYFFILDKKTTKDIDFLIGDFDNVKKKNSDRVLQENIINADYVLKCLITEYLRHLNLEMNEYIDMLKDIYKQYKPIDE